MIMTFKRIRKSGKKKKERNGLPEGSHQGWRDMSWWPPGRLLPVDGGPRRLLRTELRCPERLAGPQTRFPFPESRVLSFLSTGLIFLSLLHHQ